MFNDFDTSLTVKINAQLRQLQLKINFGDKERAILKLFYNSRFRIRRQKLFKFYIYARICEEKNDLDWSETIIQIDRALQNLISIKYINEVNDVNPIEAFLKNYVGGAAKAYELTSDGLEVLQSWHPNIALKLKAWITILPPWFILIGTIASGVGALWKIIEFSIQFFQGKQ
jgi:hypothetical protein